MKAPWMLFAVCLILVVAVNEAWVWLHAHVAVTSDTLSPNWDRIGFWMPGGIGLRIANAFGYRFEVSRWNEMGPFVFLTDALGCIICSGILFGVVVLLRHFPHSRARRHEAV